MTDNETPGQFFVAGGTMHRRSPSYVNRPADDEFFDQVMASHYCYVLTPRQMGKSSLTVRTIQRLRQADVEAVMIDLQGLSTGGVESKADLKKWYINLLEILEEELDLSVTPDEWWQNHPTLDEVRFFVTYLRDVVLAEVEGQVVIFIDEIDLTYHLPARDDFFSAIRHLYNARANDPTFERLVFVMLGVVAPADLISNPRISPFNIGQGIDLQEFSQVDAKVLQEGLEAFHPGQGENIFSHIYAWTQGHPYLTQKLCLAASETNGHWTVEKVNDLIDRQFSFSKEGKEHHLEFIEKFILSHEQREKLLKLYRQIYAGQQIKDDRQSNLHTQLKLSGLVTARNGVLDIRNKIYRRAFDMAWIKANTPVNWTRRVAIIAPIVVVILAIVLGFSIWQLRKVQTADSCIANFKATPTPNERLSNLACLFDLSDRTNDAEQLFYEELTLEDRQTLFTESDPQTVGAALIIVVKGLYLALENNEQANALLETMIQPLQSLNTVEATNLALEIRQWLRGRSLYLDENYDRAIGAYSAVIDVNKNNPGLYFDRGLAYAALGETDSALSDFAKTLELDNRRQQRIVKFIESNGVIYRSVIETPDAYPDLASLVATPTSTPSATHTPTPLPPIATPTPTQELVSSPDLSPAIQLSSTPTPTFTPTTTHIPTPTPTDTPSPTTQPDTIIYVRTQNREDHHLEIVTSSGDEIKADLPFDAAAPAWCQDSKVAFFAEPSPSGEVPGIYIADYNNGDLQDTELLLNINDVQNLACSSNGDKIAFEVILNPQASPETQESQIRVIHTATGNELARFSGSQPTWVTPQQLVIRSCAGSSCGLFSVNCIGTVCDEPGKQPLTSDSTDSFPTASLDGQYLAFLSKPDDKSSEIYLLDLADDNSRPQRMTCWGRSATTPVFSPDGKKIYFRIDFEGRWQIRAIKPDGSACADGNDFDLIQENVGESINWGLARPAVLN